jgi:hypothetical protein
VRAVHAKSHGLLKAEVTVLAGLREELRQGLFPKPASYSAVIRFSSEPGDVLSDHISTPRGLALKVIGVVGEMLPNHAGHPHSWNCLKDSIVAFFQRETAVWELRVQLCTDLTKMPVEDASVEWDERLSPSPTVRSGNSFDGDEKLKRK